VLSERNEDFTLTGFHSNFITSEGILVLQSENKNILATLLRGRGVIKDECYVLHYSLIFVSVAVAAAKLMRTEDYFLIPKQSSLAC